MDNKKVVVKEKSPSTSPNPDQVYDFELVCPEVVRPGNFFRCSGIFFAGSGVRVRLSATDFDPSIAVQISENVHVPGKSASSQFYADSWWVSLGVVIGRRHRMRRRFFLFWGLI